MTVKELKEQLEKYPDTMDVFIRQTNDEFELSLVETVTEEEVLFTEGGSSFVQATTDVVLIISDF